MPSNHLILCHSFLLSPSIFPSIRVFSNESVLHIKWPKYCSISFSISPSNEYSGLISFRMHWLGLLAVQGILKSLFPTPQFKTVSSSVLSFLYSPTLTSIPDYWKNHGIYYTNLFGKVISLLFNTLPRFVITILPRCKFSFSSVAQSCPTPSNPMDCSIPGFPLHHHLPELTQTHVH